MPTGYLLPGAKPGFRRFIYSFWGGILVRECTCSSPSISIFWQKIRFENVPGNDCIKKALVLLSHNLFTFNFNAVFGEFNLVFIPTTFLAIHPEAR